MARVYLDTSFISACVSTRVDTSSAFRREVSREWMRTQRSMHEVHVSAEVERELNSSTFKNREPALELARSLPALAINPEAAGLAAVLVRERVMPGPAVGDALHVAVSCVHQIEYLISWNVRHLANQNKRRHLLSICVRAGYTPPQIITPELLWDKQP